jgi:hypothetical protein
MRNAPLARPCLAQRKKRERAKNQLVYLDRPYYVWTIELENSPARGYIRFGAVDFTQTLRHEPVHTGNAQELDPEIRPPFTVSPPAAS